MALDYSDMPSVMMEDIAQTQGEIFFYAYKNGYDAADFAVKYMRSEFCNQEMDSICSYFHFKTDAVCFSYVNKELKLNKSDNNKTLYDAYWVGAIYRYLVFFTGLSSKEIVEKIDPATLDEWSVAYDTFLYEDAAKDIIKKLQEEE